MASCDKQVVNSNVSLLILEVLATLHPLKHKVGHSRRQQYLLLRPVYEVLVWKLQHFELEFRELKASSFTSRRTYVGLSNVNEQYGVDLVSNGEISDVLTKHAQIENEAAFDVFQRDCGGHNNGCLARMRGCHTVEEQINT